MFGRATIRLGIGPHSSLDVGLQSDQLQFYRCFTGFVDKMTASIQRVVEDRFEFYSVAFCL